MAKSEKVVSISKAVKYRQKQAHDTLIGEIHQGGLDAHHDYVHSELREMMHEAERLCRESDPKCICDLWHDVDKYMSPDEESYIEGVLETCKRFNGPIYRRKIAEIITEKTICGDCGMVPCRCLKWAIKLGSKSEGFRYFPRLFMRKHHAEIYAKSHGIRVVRILVPDAMTIQAIGDHAETLANLLYGPTPRHRP